MTGERTCDTGLALCGLAGPGLTPPLSPVTLASGVGKKQDAGSPVPSSQNALPFSLQAKSFSSFLSQLTWHFLQEATLRAVKRVPVPLPHTAIVSCPEWVLTCQRLM